MGNASIQVNTSIAKSFTDSENQSSVGISDLGTLMYDNLKLTIKEEGENDTTLTLNSIQFIVSQSRNIVKTQISGRNGTIKEYNNDGDFIIRCAAKLTNTDGRLFPEDDLNSFVRIAKSESEIDVISRILNDNFRIDTVVIEDYTVSPSTGASDVRLDFVMLSETPFDVKEFLIT